MNERYNYVCSGHFEFVSIGRITELPVFHFITTRYKYGSGIYYISSTRFKFDGIDIIKFR